MQQRQLEEMSLRLQKALDENKKLSSELQSARGLSANELQREELADPLLTSKEEEDELLKDTKEKIESLDKEFENLYKIT